MISLTVLFEDNHCLAVAKPAPLLTQAPEGIPSLERMAKDYLREKYAKKGRVYLGIPHRLDRPVTGVVLFARQTRSAQGLAEQFANRTVQKTYWGIVEGSIPEEAGEWSDWLLKVKEESRTERVEEGTPGARLAVMKYRPLETGRIEFQPRSGRMHQIRVQAALRGCPILGDRVYGSTKTFGPEGVEPRDRVIALHARSLTFLHPIRFEPITVVAEVPEYWPPV